uniref:Uncharacterized protein n=1 Tax=Arundo donax TaxID=35708 RepID=A0A0A9C029_ARUDO
MEPLPVAPNGAPPRRPIPRRSPPPHQSARLPRRPTMPMAQQAPPPPGTSTQQGTPGTIGTPPTWLPTPPAFVPRFSPPLLHISDPNSSSASIQEDCGMGPRPPGGFLSLLSTFIKLHS